MKPINLIEIETSWGFRSFELHEGDITQLDFTVDVLAISAFKGDYEPVPGTVIEALLKNVQIDMKELSKRREFDLVEAFGCWIAKVAPGKNFERILCAEIVGGKFETKEVIENVFAVLSMLEMKKIRPEILALPILGAGQQQQSASEVIKELLDCSLRYMQQSASIKKVVFVARRKTRAQELDKAMNELLGRVKVVVPRGDWHENTRRRILTSIEAAGHLAGTGTSIFLDARRVFSSNQIRSFEMGITARRLVEFIVNSLLQKRVAPDLCGRIDALADIGVAEWLRSYMHTLRIFGNESAHEKQKVNRRPAVISEADIGVCLLCLEQVLGFWLHQKKNESQTRN
ncbi:MAG TPA: DUF4145 domain-containing protein [Pyrinomonadaceae bacterium]|nr:DUF4145 domain-containing protein [Pyrinomonadaceae bacterium]